MRDERVDQLARQVIDIERVADPGEGVVEHLPAHQRGVDEPLGPRRRDAQQRQRRQVGPARAHRVYGHHGLGPVPAAGVDGQHRATLAIGADRFEQPADCDRAVRHPDGMRVPRRTRRRHGLRAIRLGGVSSLGYARGQVAQLRAEQLFRLPGQDLRRVPVVLHDPAVVVDPENDGPDGGGQGRVRALRGDAAGRGLGAVCDSGLLGVHVGLHCTASLGPVARGPRGPGGRGTVRQDTALGNACPESTALRRHAGCHVLSPDAIAGCARVNYGSPTARSDGSSDESPLWLIVPFVGKWRSSSNEMGLK